MMVARSERLFVFVVTFFDSENYSRASSSTIESQRDDEREIKALTNKSRHPIHHEREAHHFVEEWKTKKVCKFDEQNIFTIIIERIKCQPKQYPNAILISALVLYLHPPPRSLLYHH